MGERNVFGGGGGEGEKGKVVTRDQVREWEDETRERATQTQNGEVKRLTGRQRRWGQIHITAPLGHFTETI